MKITDMGYWEEHTTSTGKWIILRRVDQDKAVYVIRQANGRNPEVKTGDDAIKSLQDA